MTLRGDPGGSVRGTRAGIALIAVSAVAFGAMAILARYAYGDGVDTATLLALRFTLAAATMAVLLAWRGTPPPRGRDLGALVLLGGLGYGGQAFTFFTALTLAPAGLVALLLYLHPAMVAVLAALGRHERLTRWKLVALALALGGMVLTVGPALGGGTAAYPRLSTGIACALAAATIYSVYIVAGARVGARVPALAMATTVIAAAACVFVLAALVQGPQWPRTWVGWAAVAGIAIVSTVIAISCFFAGLARVGPTRAATLSTIEPVVTVALAALLLGERIAPVQLAGGALILAAVWLLARGPGAASGAT